MSLIVEMWGFLRERKKFWLFPIVSLYAADSHFSEEGSVLAAQTIVQHESMNILIDD